MLHRRFFQFGSSVHFRTSGDLIRAELFSPQRLQEHARSLAEAQPTVSRKTGNRVLSRRLADNEAVLLASYKAIASAVEAGQAITPAAEWILDNYHIVEEQIFGIRTDLPPGYYRELPKLASGPFFGLPRVFAIAWAYVAHTDSRFDADQLCELVEAYQAVQPLTIAELWAVPITLRIVLVENLRRAAERIVQRQGQRVDGDRFAERILGSSQRPPEAIAAVLKDCPRPYSATLIVQLAHRLHDPAPSVAPALQWLEQQVVAEGTTIEDTIQEEHHRQAAMNVTARNIITSMREISAINWSDIFERVSLVDRMLRRESGFDRLDFATRDLYRKQIEALARYSPTDELTVTSRVIALAKEATARGADERERDPGYYLLGPGRRSFERAVGFQAPPRDWPARLVGHLGSAGYVAISLLAAILVLAAVLALAPEADGVTLIALGILGSLPAIDLAVTIVNRIVSAMARPIVLPALDLQNGIPPEFRTMVVIPTLLSSRSGIDSVVEQLEVHYLSNAFDELTFAVLSDWTDAPAEAMPGDEPLLQLAAAGIAELNRRHPQKDNPRFLLLHRRRRWSETQQAWIGWERKRGKLQELNWLLRGHTDTTFISVNGVAPQAPTGVRYVVTLDSDTQLTRDAVPRLIGKMAHVMNRPRLDPGLARVVEGYGILQPRVVLALPMTSEGSWFQRMFAGASGMDPYAAPTADIYQDLFGEGSFLGKGIYDVDAFEAAMEGRTPENAILSHDLFEGIFVRAGLAGDVEVVEQFPRRYDVAASRQHRWARGDWQLWRWLVEPPGRKPGVPAPAPLLGRWKLFDNLRRSLFAPAAVLSLVIGWTLPAMAALIWTLFNLLALATPHLLPTILPLFRGSPQSTLQGRFAAFALDISTALARTGFVVATLVHQATLMIDAVVRTVWRLAVTRRRLLEWMTAEQAGLRPELNVLGSYRRMAISPLVAILAAAVAFSNSWVVGLIAMPFFVFWALGPALTCLASRNRPIAAIASLSPENGQKLRLIARATWRYFETFVTAEENWLPPDNYQEAEPRPVVAHRTSPTNIGLYLLSVAAAADFGWIGSGEAAERLEATFATLNRMHRFRGHFYNWYDTTDLRALDPQYVSTVDSGNLAGHLIALANALEEPLPPVADRDRIRSGIEDTWLLVRAAASHAPNTDVSARLEAIGSALHRLGAGGAAFGSDDLVLLHRLAQALVEAVCGGERPSEFAAEGLAATANELLATIVRHIRDGSELRDTLAARRARLAGIAREMAMQMDFRFLIDTSRMLLSIGYLASENRRDSNCYDLLASEARLASFFAIAKRDAPTKHWFRLGRQTTMIAGRPALVSWSGSMFEYLMPSLVMRAPSRSLLEMTSRLIVRRQIEYGRRLGVPWGVSEAAFNSRDVEFTYQYSNFGVPGLGLKRGLSANLVIAPYATALAAMVDPSEAVKNFDAIAEAGGLGRFGYYEALDYTSARVPTGETVAVVQAYMAHHQGMSIVAIADVLLAGIMRRRLHAEPIIAAAELLLEESSPKFASLAPIRAEEVGVVADVRQIAAGAVRQFETAHTAMPQVGLLSNTRYSVMLTNSGSGYSRWNDLAVTRWREDATLDEGGSAIYLRDLRGPRLWSVGYQPTAAKPDSYSVSFADDRAKIVRRDRTIMTTMELVVSTEQDAEVRRVSLTNMGGMDHEIEVTSYAELVLARAADDAAHPTFSKMFVETEFLPEQGVLLATRRRRDPGQQEVWAAHFVVANGEAVGEIEYETDRAKFIGVGRDLRAPAALDGAPLTNSAGTVLDPIFSLRRKVIVRPGVTVRLSFWTVVGNSRGDVLAAVRQNDDVASFERAATLAWTQGKIQLRHIDVTAAEASVFHRLAGCILFSDRLLRASDDTLRRTSFDVRDLWAQGISGDLPILLVRFDSMEDLGLAYELQRAHEFLRLKRLAFDLVMVNVRGASYTQELQQALESIARTSEMRSHLHPNVGGRVFVLRKDLTSPEREAALTAAARISLSGRHGSLSSQLDRLARGDRVVIPPTPVVRPSTGKLGDVDPLEFDNGFGGFARHGEEYVTTIRHGVRPPAPWINVVANPAFGFQVSADGSGYSWAVNSRDNQITPWSNDPVINRSGEALYLRDDDNGALWGPTAHPFCHPSGTYRARHGRGYSRFEHVAGDLDSDLTVFVPLDDPVKIMRLRLTNRSRRARRISVAAYAEWVLGVSRAQTASTIVTETTGGGTLVARNARLDLNGGRAAFLALGPRATSWTGDRAEFIGRLGTTAEPVALVAGGALSGHVGGGLDPCGALLTTLAIDPGATKDVTILLGSAASAADADGLAAKYLAADIDAELSAVAAHWDGILGAVTVSTPDRAMDIMLNGWLLYQTLACRMWARAGFYQASGAYGFRDQLQDCLALAVAAPALARQHILRAAARQFAEGDVQHWWLPATGQGVRTRISDDPVWLAHVVASYVRMTGDTAILDEPVPYLDGRALSEAEHDSFFLPERGEKNASLYRHCAKALDCRLTTGAHGLPLMGSGDWNDGMNRVGIGGKGESVWLAWFLSAALNDFGRLAEARGESDDAQRWRDQATALVVAIEKEGWDGNWYRRAFFDDGTPLGSAENQECAIDSIAQSWAVISGVGDATRARAAMAEAYRRLIRADQQMALLFTPPFDKSSLEPGYIKGYPPGLRENGGQYTHAAIWMLIAEAMQGEAEKAHALFAMLNPISHAATREAAERYKVEPYVVAADIYAAPGHVGRGGWTWYTGSAGWLYRAGVESILGLRKEGNTLRIEPCIPSDWPGFHATVRHGRARYEIVVERAAGSAAVSLSLDGKALPPSPARIDLCDDGGLHDVRLVLPQGRAKSVDHDC